MSGRRSSIHGSATGTTDPRPLSEKAWKNDAIRKLIGFLTMNGFQNAVSPKTLSAPSIKDFTCIFAFIYKKMDINYKQGTAKPEDEIPAILKSLGYPYPIKKSAIFACGSSHNWPKLLGALTWMVEVVEVCSHFVLFYLPLSRFNSLVYGPSQRAS
jgi:kinetochore protein NDC80